MKLLLLGPQGAGKGTQATLLADRFDAPHISTGDLFRAHAANATELGRLAERYMSAGELVPDAVTEAMVAARFAEPDIPRGFVLDGFPRTVDQAEWLDDLLRTQGTALTHVVVLHAPDDELVSRMVARGRPDDTPAGISRRLEIYHTQTRPIIDRYRDIACQVDGVGTVPEVHERILESVQRSCAASSVASGTVSGRATT